MSEARVGLGVDMHRFVDPADPLQADRPFVLGGVRFPDTPGLAGHSDADALAHALADALLGAAGLGDIGEHFPSDDPRYAGVDSLELLATCVARVTASGWRVASADCTVVAQRPRVRPQRDAMAKRLTDVLGAPVNVKATTPDGLGAIGRVEGVSCLAVVLLDR